MAQLGYGVGNTNGTRDYSGKTEQVVLAESPGIFGDKILRLGWLGLIGGLLWL